MEEREREAGNEKKRRTKQWERWNAIAWQEVERGVRWFAPRWWGTVDMATPRPATRIPASPPVQASNSRQRRSGSTRGRGQSSSHTLNDEESDLMPCTHVQPGTLKRLRCLVGWLLGCLLGCLLLLLACSLVFLPAWLSHARAFLTCTPVSKLAKYFSLGGSFFCCEKNRHLLSPPPVKLCSLFYVFFFFFFFFKEIHNRKSFRKFKK